VTTHIRSIIAFVLILAGALTSVGQTDHVFHLPGQGLTNGLFGLKEMDLHLHSGMGRPVESGSKPCVRYDELHESMAFPPS
jgi:hypothetical protein